MSIFQQTYGNYAKPLLYVHASTLGATAPYWQVLNGSLPVTVLQQNPGWLPQGYDLNLFRQLLEVHQQVLFSAAQLNALLQRPGFIAIMHQALASTATKPWIKPVFDFALEHFRSAELYQFFLTHPEVFEQIRSSNNPAQAFHQYLLTHNAEYAALNDRFTNASAWYWPIVGELGVELVIAILEKQGGKTVQLPLNIIQALKAIAQGDLYDFLDEAKDILAQVNIQLKIFDALWDMGELGWKANRILDKVDDLIAKLGENTTEKIWAAMDKNLNVLKNLDISDWPYGIRLNGKTANQFWDDLVEVFGVAGSQSLSAIPPRFQIPGSDKWITFYTAASTGGPSIVMGGNLFKFRF